MANLLPPGTIIQSRYQILNLLGQGGFGAVYLAQDLRLSAHKVAIKENFDNSPQSQMQFKVEADVLANLNHPSLPHVTDYFIEPSGRQYLVMDYVEGNDLETLVRQSGRLDEAQALPWIEQVCDALTYLHTHRPPIIHRDVKPGNIRVRASDGRAFLVDFGIAKVYDPIQKTLTAARAVSPGYSPLEQYGKGNTDVRSDIYSLGATMYFALTGVQPPEATDLVSSVDQLQLPRVLNPYLSPQVAQAILNAMQLFADARFQSIAALRQALHASSQPRSPYAPTLAAPPIRPALAAPSLQPPPLLSSNFHWWRLIAFLACVLIVFIFREPLRQVFGLAAASPTLMIARSSSPTASPSVTPSITQSPTSIPATETSRTTPIPTDAVAGSVLAPGQSWRSGSQSMTLRSIKFAGLDCNGILEFEVVFENWSAASAGTVVLLNGMDWRVIDDQGTTYFNSVYWEGANKPVACNRVPLTNLTKNALAANEKYAVTLQVRGTLANAITKFRFIVKRAGRITDANWEIPVPR